MFISPFTLYCASPIENTLLGTTCFPSSRDPCPVFGWILSTQCVYLTSSALNEINAPHLPCSVSSSGACSHLQFAPLIKGCSAFFFPMLLYLPLTSIWQHNSVNLFSYKSLWWIKTPTWSNRSASPSQFCKKWEEEQENRFSSAFLILKLLELLKWSHLGYYLFLGERYSDFTPRSLFNK